MQGNAPKEAALDALVRAQLVVDPPPEVQDRILASVLSAVDSAAMQAPVTLVAPRLGPIPPSSLLPPRPLSLLTYAILGLVVAVYGGLVGGFGDTEGLLTLARQAVYALTLVLRSPLRELLVELVQGLAEHAIWLTLLPIVWYLWDSDRTAARQT